MEKESSRTHRNKICSADRTGSDYKRHFAAAVVSARRGRYAEAVKLLQIASDSGECSEADALDLQARIYAQQGLYLHAESCWQRARQVDRSNPAYDEALSRLRRFRRPIGRLLQLVAVISLTIVLGLLLWQSSVGNSTITNRLYANETSLTAIRRDIGLIEESSQGRSQETATNIAALGSYITVLDSRLSDQLKTLPTAEEIAKDRAALFVHLDEQMAMLQNSIKLDINAVETSRATSDAIKTKRIEDIEAAVIEIGKLVMMVEGRLTKRLESGDADLTKRLDAMQVSVESGIKPSLAANEVAHVDQAIVRFQEKLDEIVSNIKQLKEGSAHTTTDEKH